MKSRRGLGPAFDVATRKSPSGYRSVALVVSVAILSLLLALAPEPPTVLATQPASSLLTFGFNDSGQLGNGTTSLEPQALPAPIAGMDDIVAIDAGFDHSLALRSDGRVYAWGRNDHGQLGNGTREPRTTPTLVPGLTYVTAIGAGGDFSLAIRSDGSVWQWGARMHYLDSDPPQVPDLLVPTQLATTSPSGASLGAGAGHRLVVEPRGMQAWGDNTNGQLSDGTTTHTWTPVIFRNPWGGATQAEAGFGHTVLRLFDGTLRAIGLNDSGQLGNGSVVESHTLAEVPGITDVAEIAVGDSHTLARTGDGKVWSWGEGSSGQLGSGLTADRKAPVAMTSPTGVTAIGAGNRSSFAINSSGAWFWGGSVLTPYLLPDTVGATDASGGTNHHLVLLHAVPLQLPTPVATTLMVSTNHNPAYVGEPLTLTFTVAPGPDMGTISRAPDPVGPFTPIATINPATGTATFERTYTSVGTYPAWYRFDGVPGFVQSPIVYFEQPVVQHATTTSATPASATVGRGDPLTVTATITPIPTDSGYAGYAGLRDGGTPIGGAKLVNPATGVVTFTINSLEVGLHDLYVDFGGTDRFAASTSSRLGITIFDRPTTTAVQIAPNPSKWGEPAIAQVHVSPIPDDGGGVRLSRDGHVVGWATMDWTTGLGTFALDGVEPGVHSVVAEFVAAAYVPRWGPSSATVNQTVSSTPIDTDPPVGTVSINGGAAMTTEGYVVVSMHATDTSRMSVAMSCDGADWQNAGTTDGDWGWGFGNTSCTPDQGVKTIYVRFADLYGNTTVVSDSIVLENGPPTGVAIVADGAAYATSATVDVDVAATDAATGVADVALSNDGATWSTRPYAPTQTWQLAGNDGVKTVHVKWRDGYGNWSAPVTDNIALDRLAPSGSIAIADGAAHVFSTVVSVSVPAADAVSGLTKVALSNDGSTWTARAYAPNQIWTLDAGAGSKTVYAQWLDGAGNWSVPVSDAVVLDSATSDMSAPTTTGPSKAFVVGSTVTSGPAVRFTWSGVDAGSGIDHYELALQADLGAYATLSSSLPSATLTRALAAGHTYRARVRAVDRAGNVGAWAYGSAFKLSGYQESSRSIRWSGTWRTGTSPSFWGGRDRYATPAGAGASLTFTGRSFAWVGSVGPTRGWARVYVNGVLVRSVNLNASVSANRRILFATSWSVARSRTVTIRISGTAGHPRGDIDALVVGS